MCHATPKNKSQIRYGLDDCVAFQLGAGAESQNGFRPDKGSVFWIEADSEVLATVNNGLATKDPVSSPNGWPVNDF